MTEQVIRRETDRQQIRHVIGTEALVLYRGFGKFNGVIVGEGGHFEPSVEFWPRRRLAAIDRVWKGVAIPRGLFGRIVGARAPISFLRQQSIPLSAEITVGANVAIKFACPPG